MKQQFSVPKNEYIDKNEIVQYKSLNLRRLQLERDIEITRVQIRELNKSYYLISTSTLSDMPLNRRVVNDRICKQLLRMESEKRRLQEQTKEAVAELRVIKWRLSNIQIMVRKISDVELRKIIRLRFLAGKDIGHVSERLDLTERTVYKKIRLFLDE